MHSSFSPETSSNGGVIKILQQRKFCNKFQGAPSFMQPSQPMCFCNCCIPPSWCSVNIYCSAKDPVHTTHANTVKYKNKLNLQLCNKIGVDPSSLTFWSRYPHMANNMINFEISHSHFMLAPILYQHTVFFIQCNNKLFQTMLQQAFSNNVTTSFFKQCNNKLFLQCNNKRNKFYMCVFGWSADNRRLIWSNQRP